MIQALANRMASYVVNNDKTETANHEVLAYGFGLIINGIVTYAAVFTSALMFGIAKEMLIAMITCMLMRLSVGGCHANSRGICFVSYAGTLYLSIFLSSIISLNLYAIAVLYLVNLFLLILYAPGDTAEQPMVKNRLVRKIAGLLLVSFFFGLSLLLQDMRIEANILMLVPTFSCVFLHPYAYKMYGCKRSLYS